MSRHARKVPADWIHPKNKLGKYIPLRDGENFHQRCSDWDIESLKWKEGLRINGDGVWIPLDDSEKAMSFEEWDGERPVSNEYMPVWSEADRTHFMMYEETSEGTPISPAFQTAEELARWLVENGANSFSGEKTTYEHWLSIIGDSSFSLPVFSSTSQQ
jgi:hypothetical protein